MDIQLLLVFTLAILTISIVAVCVYIIVILREFQDTIKKANTVLEHTKGFTNKLSNPTPSLITLLESGISTLHTIKDLKHAFNRDDHKSLTMGDSYEELNEMTSDQAHEIVKEEVKHEVSEKVGSAVKSTANGVKDQITNLFDAPGVKKKTKNFFRGTLKE